MTQTLIHTSASRRFRLRALAALFAALALLTAACGDDDSESDAATASTTEAAEGVETAEADAGEAAATDEEEEAGADEAEEEAGAGEEADAEDTSGDESAAVGETRTVETVDGPVEVPADPQRIVAMQDQNALLPLLELGVVPVASAGDQDGDGQSIFRRVDDFDTSAITWIGNFREPNLEAVAEQRPDLIVTDPFAGSDQLDQLLAIAPVARIDPFDQPLVDALAQWADLVGRSEQGAEFRAAYDARIAALVEAIGDPAEITIAVVSAYDGGSIFYYEDGSQATGQVVGDLGLDGPDLRDPAGEFSIETFPEHVADYVVVYDFGGAEDPDGEIDQFVESPLFLAHPAVAAGQWARVDATQTVGSGWSKLDNLIDVLEPLLTDPDLDRSIDS
ncbi:MAG: ABC transporter substrate-binding protein [Acidimicrobiales bacterium]